MRGFSLLWTTLAALATGQALAQSPRVLLDTDRGPLLLELDQARAPNTVANFLRYVDAGRFNDTLIHRVAKDFVVQGGGFKADTTAIARFETIASERNNGLSNTAGTVAMGLVGTPPNVNSASSDFFINTGNNATLLNPNFTVFGRVVFGQKTLSTINGTTVFQNSEDPVRIPYITRAVRVAAGAFPILPLHTGSWYDPANAGKGFVLEVSQASGSETGPLVIVSWYDFHEGKQIWLYGLKNFNWGDSSVEVPVQISTGAQFGSAFNPSQIIANANWGKITVRFTGCDAGSFTYTSIYGNGTFPVRSLTLPTDKSCAGQ